jgi:integrase
MADPPFRFTGQWGRVLRPVGRLVRERRAKRLGVSECFDHRHLDPSSVYRNIVTKYADATGVSAEAIGVCVHSIRATAATIALSNDLHIAKVHEWLGHAKVSTTLYDRRKTRPEDSLTFHVKY